MNEFTCSSPGRDLGQTPHGSFSQPGAHNTPAAITKASRMAHRYHGSCTWGCNLLCGPDFGGLEQSLVLSTIVRKETGGFYESHGVLS